MGKKQKKAKQGNTAGKRGLLRKIQYETSRARQQRLDARHRYQVAMSYTTTVQARCTHCQTEAPLNVEKIVLPVIGDQILNHCATCDRVMTFDMMTTFSEDLISNTRGTDALHEKAIAACKRHGLKARFWNQYLLITGREMRWYLEYAAWHKNLYFCSKWHRLTGTKQGFTLFFSKRVCSINEAVADIAMCEEMSASTLKLNTGVNMSPDLKIMLRRQRIMKACRQYSLEPVFNENSVTIQTAIGEWKFDYTRDRITLLHKNSSGPVLEPLSGAVLDYHVQYANADKTVEDVIDGIVAHDEWRAGVKDANS